MSDDTRTDAGEVYARFAKAFASISSISKASKNQHHGYAYRGIDDVFNALHGVLAEQELFYVPRLVGEAYEEWQTSKGKRMQVARMTYEFVFYAPDGSSLTVGPVVGQSADTDDKAPMQALSQAAKPALLNAFCIPTEDMRDGDAASPVEAEGGRVVTPVDLSRLEALIVTAQDVGVVKDWDKAREYASRSQANADKAADLLADEIREVSGGAAGDGPAPSETQEVPA